MRKILVFSLIVVFVVICCIPCLAASSSDRAVPFEDYHLSSEHFDNNDGSSTSVYYVDPQCYKFNLWDCSVENPGYIGEFINESRVFNAFAINGSVCPFLNDSENLEAYFQNGITTGYYMPIDNERRPDSISFDFGLNIRAVQSGSFWFDSLEEISGDFTLYFIIDPPDGNVQIVERKFSDIVFQGTFYPETYTVQYISSVTFDFRDDPLKNSTIHGFIPLFRFDSVELQNDSAKVFFPFFNFEFYTSAASNLRFDMIDLGVIEGDLQDISSQGFDFSNQIFASFEDIFIGSSNALAACSYFIDGLSSIPSIRNLIVVSLGVGIVASLLGFVFEYLRRK